MAEIAAGRFVIETDDEDRENEGNLMTAADKATPENINVMIRHPGDPICVPATAAHLRHLGIAPMMKENREPHRTAFAVSVDATKGSRLESAPMSAR